MTHLIIHDTPSDKSFTTWRVLALAWRSAMPKPIAHAKMPMKLALAMALTGLSTTLNTKVFKTSLTLAGGALAASATWANTNCVGNSKLAATATMDAPNVPTKYKIKMGLM